MKKILLLSLLGISLIADAQNGWTSLFNGKDLSGWKRMAGTADYQADHGMICGRTVFGSPNSFLVTEKTYSDFFLELEVKIDDTTANSGIQLRSHFDPAANNNNGKVFGYQYELDPSSRQWTGGIYDEGRRDWLYPLMLNKKAQPAFKLHVFNKVHIECIGHEIRTWINGVPAACMIDTMDHSGFIGLQVHAISRADQAGEMVCFKNIRIKTTNLQFTAFPKDIYVLNNIPNTLSPLEKKNGWQLLFDGKTTNGWVGAYKDKFPDHGWEVKDGVITVLGAEGKESANGGDIVTTEQFSHFDLSFDFRFTPGANSGVKYFVTLKENNNGSAIGLEYQVLDDSLHPDAKLGRNGNRTLASL